MPKTIHECDLVLVAHSVAASKPISKIGLICFNDETEEPQDLFDEALFKATNQKLDFFPASAARVSFGNEDKTGKDPAADLKLMKYLAEHEHMSPFEHQSATFMLEVPLFIRSQIMRHRTFGYNEISRRYTAENIDYFVPDTFRGQAKNNRQASVEDAFLNAGECHRLYGTTMGFALQNYEYLLAEGVCREQARAVLPQSVLTKFFMTGNLRNWAHFVKLRTHEGAQLEVRVVAERISAELRNLWPNAWGVLHDGSI
jgi:thymidylate synthase (FAD)